MSALDDIAAAARLVIDTAGVATVAIGRDGRGSGLVVGPDLVLTNAHNLRDRTTMVTFADGEARQGRAVGVDSDGDVAVVTVATGSISPVAWSTEPARPGDVVFAVSRGLRGPRVSFGLVSAVDRPFRGPRGRLVHGSVEHSAPLGRGSSGGPLLDRSGALLGINTHRIGDGFYLALVADEQLRARVDALTVGDAPDRPRLGVALAPVHVARRLRRAVGLPDRDGLLVRAVEEGGAADRAGLRQGDLIVAAAGEPTVTPDDLHRALDRGPGPLVVTLVRGADEISLTVDVV